MRTIGLYGDSGSGKTTQGGEYAKHIFKTLKKRTRYHGADLGGYDSIVPLERIGILDVVPFNPEVDDPWAWINNAVEGRDAQGKEAPSDIGLHIFDSGTSMGEALLNSCAKLSAAGQEIGGRPAPKFVVNRLDANKRLNIGTNVDSHYMVVQTFLLDAIWKSTWLTRTGADVLWTFSVHRGEKADETPVLGAKLAGKALTASIPKWLKYFFRITSIPQLDRPAIHRLYLQEQPELTGTTFGNARYPLDAQTSLPVYVEPANLAEAIRLIEQGQEEAYNKLREELGIGK